MRHFYIMCFFVTCSIFMPLHTLQGVVLTYDEAHAAAEAAQHANPWLKTLFEEGQTRRKLEAEQLQGLRVKIKERLGTDAAPSGNVYEAVQQAIRDDLSYLNEFNTQISLLNVGEEGMTWPLKTNKLTLGLQEALKITEAEFDQMIDPDQHLPARYGITPPLLNILGSQDYIYGSGRAVPFKIILLTALRVLHSYESLRSDREYPTFSHMQEHLPNLDTCPFLHRVPLPASCAPPMNSAWVIPGEEGNDQSPPALLIPHNGYGFGDGHYHETQNPYEMNPHGPLDCSAFVWKSLGKKHHTAPTPYIPSTWHTYQHYCGQHPPSWMARLSPSIQSEWQAARGNLSPDDPYMSVISSALTPFGPDKKDLSPGLIYTTRSLGDFYLADPTTHEQAVFGNGGHTGIYIGSHGGQGPEACAIILGCNRAMTAITDASGDFPYGGRDGTYALELAPLWSSDFTQPGDGKKAVFYYDIL